MNALRSVLVLACGLPVVSLGCSASPPEITETPAAAKPPVVIDGCTVPDPENLRRFPSCPTGGGSYGQWIVDAYGLPAFDYTFDQLNDPRAAWPNSEDIPAIKRVRKDHFVVLGNRRVNFVAVDEGYVMLYSNERAPAYVNRFSEEQRNLGGGFSYVNDAGVTYSSAYRYVPDHRETRRIFGTGYYQTETRFGGLRIRHTIYAPHGDDPLLIDDVEVENTTDQEKRPRHFEYWDVNHHQLLIEWIRTGLGAAPSDRGRDQLNDRFTQRTTYDSAKRILTSTMQPKLGVIPPPADAPSREDYYPAPTFLAAISGSVDETYVDQDAFFGTGSVSQPESVRTLPPSTVMADRPALGQPAALIMRSDLSLAPHATVKLRFAYGSLPPNKDLSMLDRYRDADPLRVSLDKHREELVYAYEPQLPLLHRETAWRTQLLLGHTVYNDYYKESYTAQGSAYLYLHGADGVPRDQALFSMPLTYVDPALAKGNLRLIFALTDGKTGELPYSFTNFGQHDGATIHNHPSDLDIYLLLAVGEYLAATGDLAFLGEHVPYYPRGSAPPPGISGDTVLDHLRVAFRHLKDTVGLGQNGLVRILDGDWSDGIVYEDLSPTAIAFTSASGESVPNSQIALYALPILSEALKGRDAALAADLMNYANALRQPVRKTFGTRWFGRAWLRNTLNQAYLKGTDQQNDPFRSNYIDLEAQPWGLLSGVLTEAEAGVVVDQVARLLDDPSPIGPMMREGGMVWPAISQLMTWAYARNRPALAWRSLERQLYATHAKRWPEVWPAIWSGPDGLNSSDGQSWVSPVTPMTDFPVSNMNQEAMWILGLLRTAGVAPSASGDGLDIAPGWGSGHDEFIVDTPLLKVAAQPQRLSGEYRAKTSGSIVLRLGLPKGVTASLRVDGKEQLAMQKDGKLAFRIAFARGQTIPFEASW